MCYDLIFQEHNQPWNIHCGLSFRMSERSRPTGVGDSTERGKGEGAGPSTESAARSTTDSTTGPSKEEGRSSAQPMFLDAHRRCFMSADVLTHKSIS